MLVEITTEPLTIEPFIQHVRRDDCGALALFLGVVRNHSAGRRVLHLEYDSYPEMAERKLREVAEEALARWPIADVAIAHRTGRLEIGETSLLVVVSSSHRREAFAACQHIVDRVKEVVPIWKKEVWDGGESWIEGEPVIGK
jgi:molybdopterin synthase catalytic subunit